MTESKFIRNFLHLKDLTVKKVRFQNYNKELVLTVAPLKCGALCPHCLKRGKIVNDILEHRVWRDLFLSGTTVYLEYAPREIMCPTHGRVQENIPWAESYSRITYRLEHLILLYSQLMTQKAAAAIINLPKSTFSNILHRSITERRLTHTIRNLKSIGLDEISYCKGKKYATVVYDLETSKVIWIGKGKGRETIDFFFENFLSKYQRENIDFASCDMGETYIGAIKDYCPYATLILDKFHIVKAINEAVDSLRKEEWRKLTGDKKKTMKGLRWLLFKHSRNRTKSETRLLNELKKSNRRIHRAWVLKDEFESFWEYSYQSSAEKFIRGWITAVRRSRLEPMKKFVKTLENHLDNILTYIGTGITNAVSEGVNRVIRFVKNRASGYSNFYAFTDIIYLVIGDVNIPNQIPAKFRTLKIEV